VARASGYFFYFELACGEASAAAAGVYGDGLGITLKFCFEISPVPRTKNKNTII
jgi:hypothetical protein